MQVCLTSKCNLVQSSYLPYSHGISSIYENICEISFLDIILNLLIKQINFLVNQIRHLFKVVFKPVQWAIFGIAAECLHACWRPYCDFDNMKYTKDCSFAFVFLNMCSESVSWMVQMMWDKETISMIRGTVFSNVQIKYRIFSNNNKNHAIW